MAPPHPADPRALTDDDLMARLDAGSVEDSLGILQERYRDQIFGFVLKLLGDVHLAQDVTQETFERVFLKSHLYVPQANFRAWLFEVARNQALTTMRSRRRLPRPFSSFGDGENEGHEVLAALLGRSDDRELEERELMAAFERAVAGLPERYREVFEMCVLRGLQYRECGDLLGLPTGTVAIRIMRARKRLFQELEPHFERLRRPPACLQP